jgi:peptide/nickel transport system permease protein
MATVAAPIELLDVERKRRSPFAHFMRRLMFEKRLGFVGAIIVVIFIVMAAASPILATSDPNAIGQLDNRLQSPSLDHPLGTDQLARDVMSRVIHGARVSVTIGFIAVAISTFLSVSIGVVSGYFTGWFDMITQRFVDAFIAFPGLVFLVLLIALFGSSDIPGLPKQGVLSTGTFIVVISLGLLGGVSQSRVIRSAALSVAASTYVDAAKSVGASDWRIVFFHVLPNVLAPVITLATLGLGGIILAEATLSFLGLGVPPDVPTWGGMLNREGRTYLPQGYWWLVAPGVALSLVVFGFNILGDALRDILDPRLRTG